MENAYADHVRSAWSVVSQRFGTEYREERSALERELNQRNMATSGERWVRATRFRAKYTEQAIHACFEQLDQTAAAMAPVERDVFWQVARAGLSELVTQQLRSDVLAMQAMARQVGAGGSGVMLGTESQLGQSISQLRCLIDNAVRMRITGNALAERASQAMTTKSKRLAPGSKVFISSTLLDNRERRQDVRDALIRAGMVPVGMELFTASTSPPVEECLRLVTECDAYVGILAHRYGWIPDGYDRSITELEYDAAKAAGLPCYIFMPQSSDVNFERDIDEGADRWKKQEKLELFKRKCGREQTCGRFDEKSLGVMVFQALQQRELEPRPTAAGKGSSSVSRDDELGTRNGLSASALAMMQWLAHKYVEAKYPNHKVWKFSSGSDDEVVFAELRALGLICTFGLGGKNWLLTDAGQRWVMQHRSDPA